MNSLVQRFNEATGGELEQLGTRLVALTGLTSVYPLNQVSLAQLDTDGAYSTGDCCEFDLLIPHGSTCVVVEITSRTKASKVESKYRRFVRSLNALKKSKLTDALWSKIGVPQETVGSLRQVTCVRGLFMATQVDVYDVNLEEKADVAVCLASAIHQLADYVEAIGVYSKDLFLTLLGIPPARGKRPIELTKTDHNLFATLGVKLVSGSDAPSGDILTFEADPYELIEVAHVYRRDMLPSLSIEPLEYQRALRSEKLQSMRDTVLHDPMFVFPNSILLLLNRDCQFSVEECLLRIPQLPGSLSVIDGQHRLYAYADSKLERQLRGSARILATAIRFDVSTDREASMFGARAFVEINSNQTTIDRTHIDAIAYDILGLRNRKALAAKILYNANSKRDRRNALYGIFQTGQSLTGKIAAKTVLTKLATLCNVEHVRKLGKTKKSSKSYSKRLGYQRALALKGEQLAQISHEEFVGRFTSALVSYFGTVSRTFPDDFPRRDADLRSALEYSKMIAAFVRLYGEFLKKGHMQKVIERKLESMKSHVASFTKPSSGDPVMPANHNAVPNANDKESIMLDFLAKNICSRTPVQRLR
jgi:hypothetical protein